MPALNIGSRSQSTAVTLSQSQLRVVKLDQQQQPGDSPWWQRKFRCSAEPPNVDWFQLWFQHSLALVSSPSVARVLVVNVFSFRCAQDADKPNYETRHLKPNHTGAVLFSFSQSLMYLILKAFNTQSATNQGLTHIISNVINSLGRHSMEKYQRIWSKLSSL